jgi:hypothetical protein
MLINFSNHPSSQWPDNQKQAAKDNFGEVIDIPFPNIDPRASCAALEALAERFINDLTSHENDTIHIMGELTFTYIIVNKMRLLGRFCVASTTERKVEMDGDIKKVKFEFVAFRAYY